MWKKILLKKNYLGKKKIRFKFLFFSGETKKTYLGAWKKNLKRDFYFFFFPPKNRKAFLKSGGGHCGLFKKKHKKKKEKKTLLFPFLGEKGVKCFYVCSVQKNPPLVFPQ